MRQHRAAVTAAARPFKENVREMDMTELYEFAKQFDVIVIFILLYGFAVGSIVYWITDFLHWCWTKFKKHREKKRQAAKQPEE